VKSRSAPLSQWAGGLAESIRSPRKQLKVPFVYEGGTMACILGKCCKFVVEPNVGVDDREFNSSPRKDRE
jgi:hypothetical protein